MQRIAVGFLAKEFLNHPSLSLSSLVCALDDVAAHITNGKNCSVTNGEPSLARFFRVKLPTLEGRDVLFSQIDRSIDTSAIGVLISLCSFCFNDVFDHTNTPTTIDI